MKPFLAIAISLSGWLMSGTYLIYEYEEYGKNIVQHLFSPHEFPMAVFHFMILLAPAASTVLGYFVHERVSLLSSIRELERRYRDYYDNAPCGYHSIGEDLTLLDVNSTWLRMLGYRKEEVVGKMKAVEFVAEESIETFKKYHPVLVEQGKIDNVEIEFKRKDGSLLSVLVSSTAVYDENGRFLRSRTIVEDNAKRKNYQEALKAVAGEWQETFDSMPWGVMLLSNCCEVVRANENFSRLAGVSAEVLAATKCPELIESIKNNPDDEGGMRGTGMLEYHEPDSGRFFRLYGRPIVLDGYVRNYVVSLVDITDIKEGEKRLLDSRDAFFNMLKDVNAAYNELNELHNNLVLAFANAIDAKSPWTKGHSERVSRYATALAREAGLNESHIAELRTAALLHDIGKIGTYDYLLDKPEGLTPEEFEFVKKHPMESVSILKPISRFGPIIDVVKYHHERYDGAGYPFGLRGEEIPLMARILCIADCYDSMTADRPYRPAQSREYAVDEIRNCSGSHFDPGLVAAFLRVIEKGVE